MKQAIRTGVVAATLLFTLVVSTVTAVALAGQSLPAITIFVNDRTEFQVRSRSDLEITLHNLDEIHRVESRINAALPADQVSAQEIAMDQVKRHEETLISAWMAIVQARAWRIQWLPAIVFGDGEAVWYGGDLDAAISAWQAHPANDVTDDTGPQ